MLKRGDKFRIRKCPELKDATNIAWHYAMEEGMSHPSFVVNRDNVAHPDTGVACVQIHGGQHGADTGFLVPHSLIEKDV